MSDNQVVPAYNPLTELGITQAELRRTLINEFESRDCDPLPEPRETFDGCGVYGLYYFGDYEYYEPIRNEEECEIPIYVGKAVPKGSRRGQAELESSSGRKLYERLREHRNTIEHAENLSKDNFRCRYLITASVWIRYAEQTLISHYRPWWNRYIDGFGIHHPGSGRADQEESMWDCLHPGRPFVDRLGLPSRGDRDDVWNNEILPRIEQERDEIEDRGVTLSEFL